MILKRRRHAHAHEAVSCWCTGRLGRKEPYHLTGKSSHFSNALTLAEYRRFIEKDAALERRFQPILVKEPTPEETVELLQGLKAHYEEHHSVDIAAVALTAAVELSVRYLPDRQLPDKALDVLDEACAMTQVVVSGLASPARGNRITADVVAQIIATKTGIPMARLSAHERQRLQDIEAALWQRVIGQDEAVTRVAGVLRRASVGLKDPRRPLGVFLFLGPTGVGKTLLAKALRTCCFTAKTRSSGSICPNIRSRTRWPNSLGRHQELWMALGRRPAHDADCLLDRLKRLAKRDGSPLILERHLLQALLVSPSGATDGALHFLRLSRDTLRAAWQRLHPLADIPWSRSIFPACSGIVLTLEEWSKLQKRAAPFW
jgi:hypothetical protein